MPTIREPLDEQDLEGVRRFLAPEPEGRGYFENFVIQNPAGEAWGILGSGGRLEGQTSARRLFDLWQLVATVLPEAAGANRNHILYEDSAPLAAEPLSPQAIQVSRSVFYRIADQLAGVVRGLDPRIPLVSNGSVFLESLPKLLDG